MDKLKIKEKVLKLHIGGRQVKEGWTIINALDLPGVDIVGDVMDLSQFPDESCDAVYASHVLEHVPQQKVINTMSGIARILKKDGKFFCSVPDLDILSRLLIHEKLDVQQKYHVMRMMFGGQVDEYDFHYIGYTWDFFKELFAGQSGFKKMTRVEDFGLFDDTSNFKPYGILISLNIIFEK